jgi:hypothetical protein
LRDLAAYSYSATARDAGGRGLKGEKTGCSNANVGKDNQAAGLRRIDTAKGIVWTLVSSWRSGTIAGRRIAADAVTVECEVTASVAGAGKCDGAGVDHAGVLDDTDQCIVFAIVGLLQRVRLCQCDAAYSDDED